MHVRAVFERNNPRRAGFSFSNKIGVFGDFSFLNTVTPSETSGHLCVLHFNFILKLKHVSAINADLQ